MKTKIEIKNRFTKETIFEFEAENNSILKTLKEAIKSHANLIGADLRSANLIGADLSHANLSRADLSYADLRSADLRSAKNKDQASLPQYCKWSHSIIGENIKIGCKTKSLEGWDLFFASDEIYETDRDSEDFKQIQAIFESYKAYMNLLKK